MVVVGNGVFVVVVADVGGLGTIGSIFGGVLRD